MVTVSLLEALLRRLISHLSRRQGAHAERSLVVRLESLEHRRQMLGELTEIKYAVPIRVVFIEDTTRRCFIDHATRADTEFCCFSLFNFLLVFERV